MRMKTGKRLAETRDCLRSRSGSALVEVTAAFVMLMILLAVLTASFDLAGSMLAKSRSMRRQLESVRRACYLEESDIGYQEQDIVLELVRREDGAVVSVDAVLCSYSDGAVMLYEVMPGGSGEVDLWNDLWEGQE